MGGSDQAGSRSFGGGILAQEVGSRRARGPHLLALVSTPSAAFPVFEVLVSDSHSKPCPSLTVISRLTGLPVPRRQKGPDPGRSLELSMLFLQRLELRGFLAGLGDHLYRSQGCQCPRRPSPCPGSIIPSHPRAA